MKENRSKKKRFGPVLVKILIALILIAGLIWYLSYRAEKTIVVPDVRDTDMYVALAEFGLDDAVIDITDKQILVSYNLKDKKQEEEALFLTLGAAHQIAPSAQDIIIMVFYDIKPFKEITVAMTDVTLYAENKLSEEDFKKRIIVREIS